MNRTMAGRASAMRASSACAMASWGEVDMHRIFTPSGEGCVADGG
jgi:hypothetical protein